MATFDTLIDDLAGRYGLGGNARSLIKEALTMISSSPGGLGGFLDTFKSAGLTSEVASWLGHPNAGPITAGQVERALGATALGGIAGRLGLAQSVVSTALGYALPKIVGLLTPGGAVPAGRARGGHGFSLATASRSGDGTGRAAAARCLSGERAERFRRPALAMAGARCVGRRWPPFLFLVDAQPDAVRSARRKGAGAGDARALDRRAGAVPAASSFASGASASRRRLRPTAAQTPPPAPQPAAQAPAPAPSTEAQHSFAGFASAASTCSVAGSAGDGASTRAGSAPSTETQATAPQASPLPAAQAPAAPTSPPSTEQTPATPAPAAVATAEPTAPASAATPTRLALSNDNGVVRASGVVRDEDAKTSILNALNAVFSADKVKSDISVDKSAAAAPWLGDFRAALEALKGANVDAIFEGDKVNVGGGAMEDAARDKIIAALKSALGASVAVGALSDKTAAAVAIANDRATTELASLQSGFAVKDLLFALNDSVVNFPSASAEVPESMAPFLKSAAAELKQLKAGHVLEIAGYTDNTGDAALNLALSQRRAEAVREALIKYGAAPDMLVAKGYGEADPIASNDTAEGRLKNRRIEYHVVKAPT